MKQLFKPHDYQKYCISRCITDDKLGLFLDMGLGKTAITLTAINDLKYNRFSVNKVLVIAPKKVAEDTWTREQEKWEHLKLLKVIPVLGSVSKRIKALNTRADVYVINRENTEWLVDYYKNDWPFDMVVIDELSSFKNNNSKRFKALKNVRPLIKKIIGLTGTPAPNGYIDLWAQIYLLDQGERLGKYITHFRENYFEPDKRNAERVFTYKPKDFSVEVIKNKISDICISLQAKDYLKMPEKIIDNRFVKLDAKAQKGYDEFERNMFLRIDEDEIDVTSAVALSNKLLQYCNGAVYKEDSKEYVEVHNCKIEAFLELVEEAQGQPLLVFYNFQSDLERLKKALSKLKLRVGILKDSDDITKWNNKELDILLAHPASAAYGLNLQDGGSHIVWFGLNWSLELYKQANARLYRQGQKSTVFIHNLIVDGCRDVDVIDALEGKNANQDALLESLKARIKKVKEGSVKK